MKAFQGPLARNTDKRCRPRKWTGLSRQPGGCPSNERRFTAQRVRNGPNNRMGPCPWHLSCMELRPSTAGRRSRQSIEGIMQVHKIGILGGTGNEGGGLAARLSHAGHSVTIGSRDEAKAHEAARQLALLRLQVEAGDNRLAAASSDIIILTVPFQAQLATLESVKSELQGKILIDATVPLVPPKVSRVQLPPEGSAVVRAQRLLGENVRVVSAFQNVSAHHLRDLSHPVECDVIVCGDDATACDTVIALV